MTLNNIKTIRKDRGFTIVELLIVIVVIAILAAIVIVAYQGITAKANTTKAQTNAVTAQKVAEAINADNSAYPTTTTAFGTGSASVKMPSGVTILKDAAATPLNANNGTTSVAFACSPDCTTPTGGRIAWWSYGGNATYPAGVNYVYIGAASSGSTFAYPTT